MLALIQRYLFPVDKSDLSSEEMENIRMNTSFSPKEIIRLRKYFLEVTNGKDVISQEIFMAIDSIMNNPLLDRICVCFGFTPDLKEISFLTFIIGLASFNSPGLKEQKLRVAFRIQDFDGDGALSHDDLYKYMEVITNKLLTPIEINKVIGEIFKEVSVDKADKISFTQFQTIVVPLDFEARLQLPI